MMSVPFRRGGEADKASVQYADDIPRHNARVTEPTDPDGLYDGPTLNADGQLEKRISAVEPPTPEPVPELQLREAPPPPLEPPPEPAPRAPTSPALKIVVALFVVGTGIFGAVLYFKPHIPVPDGVREGTLLDAIGPAANGHVIISSQPAGAAIFIDGENVGVTPWATDNRWSGEVKVKLVARGYKAWESTFVGGTNQTLDVQLKR